MPVSQQINAFESRWALKSYRATDASKITPFSLERLAEAEHITLAQYRARRAERAAIRTIYAALAGECDAAITLTATGPAPLGLESTGDPSFVVAGIAVSACRRSRCRCSRSKGCPSDCNSSASSIAMPS